MSVRFHPLHAAFGAVALTAALASYATTSSAPADGAPATASSATSAVAAPLIAPPPASVGDWQDLGYFLAPWMAGDAPVPITGPSAPTRVAGLRRADGHWLAIVIVQVAPAGSAPCPTPNSLHADSIGLRDNGCLRIRGDADFDRWLQQQHSVLYHWLDGRGWTSRPRAWVSYRVLAGDHIIETHALLHPALLEPATRNNIDFLAGGQTALRWAQRFADATRAADGGTLSVPPFPFAPQVTTPTPPAATETTPPPAPAASAPTRACSPAMSATCVLPTRAEQVSPPPPAPAPRRDRE